MGPRGLLFFWVYVIHETGTTDFRTRCEVPSVQRGEATNITCYFGTDISQTKTDCAVRKYDNDGKRKGILHCLLSHVELPECDVDQGYVLKGDVTDTLVLQIQSAGEDHVGIYVCLTIPSDPSDLEPCTFTLKNDTSTMTSTEVPQNNTTVAGISDNNTVVVAVALSAGILIIICVIAVGIYWCRRRQTYNAGGDVSQRLLHQTSENLEKSEKEDVPYDHDTYNTALKQLEEKGVVIIMGPERCGKTTIGRALQRYFMDREYTPLSLNRHDKWHHFKRYTGKLFVLLDEVIGTDDKGDTEDWKPVFKFMRERRCFIVVIIRTNPEAPLNKLPRFLEDFPTVLAASDNLKNELFRVCEKGELNGLQALVRHHVDVNVVNDKGETPLHVACTHGHDDIARELLKIRPDLHVQDSQGQTPLHRACSRGEAKVALSQNAGSKPSIVDGAQGRSASGEDCDEVEQTAVDTVMSGGKGNMQSGESDFKDQKTTHVAHEVSQIDGIVQLLIDAGADPDVTDKKGRTPLHLACQKGNDAAVESLLRRMSNLNLQDHDGYTTLHIACEQGDHAIVDRLLKAGASLEIRDENGAIPLHFACQNGHTGIISSLLGLKSAKETKERRQRTKEATDNRQWTPLRWACKNGNAEAVAVLLDEAGANIEAEDGKGVRALHVVCESGNEQIVQILLDHDADVNAKTKAGKRPSDLAKKYNHRKVSDLLKRAEGRSKSIIPSFTSVLPHLSRT